LGRLFFYSIFDGLKNCLLKKLLLFFFFLLSFFSKAQTSVYHPFPDSNAVWNMRQRGYCIAPGDYCDFLYSYIITGDTIIAGNSYHKLSVPIVERTATGGTCTNCSGFWPGADAGFIRQDIPGKKVYFIEQGNSIEQLLYDFNMQTSDTVKGYMESACGSNPDIVGTIDSVLIGSNYRKRWDLTGGHYEYLIEGIGLIQGLGDLNHFLGQSDCGFIDGPFLAITCFVQNDTILYHPLPSYACEVITGIKNISENNNSINIYPNPTHDNFTITLNRQVQNGELKIYDVTGRMVMEQKLHSQISSINCQLSSGIYFLKVLLPDTGEELAGKIAVSK
jgi:hypothetical protein